MKTQKTILKIVYCLTGLLLIASIGLNIYQYQKINKLSENAALQTVTKDESIEETKAVKKDEPIEAPITAPVKMVQESTLESTPPPVSEEIPKKETGVSEIDELEYHLNAAEEELDMTSEQLADELTQKKDFKKAAAQLQKDILANPAYKELLKNSAKQTMDKNYDPLEKLMELPPEKFNEFKDILVDQMMDAQGMSTLILEASTADEKEEVNRQIEDISNKYDNNIRDLLGEENYSIYKSYDNRLSERNSLNSFMESLPPENRINDEQAEMAINSMYEARKSVLAAMGPDNGGIRFPSDLNEKTLARQMERSSLVYEKYAEVSRNIMSPKQAEQFKTFLEKQREMIESQLKMNSYLIGGKTDQENDEEESD